jgi:hypothetical protein
MSENKIQTKLTPGTYRCTENVSVLRDDKRRTSDWRYQPILAGTLFFYTEWTYEPCDDGRKVTECRLYPVGKYSSEECASQRIVQHAPARGGTGTSRRDASAVGCAENMVPTPRSVCLTSCSRRAASPWKM